MTRVAASDWIFENVPTGATLLYETPDGKADSSNCRSRRFYFEYQGVPLFVDFALPEDGTLPASG